MAIVVVQESAGASGSTANPRDSLPGLATAGNLLVAFVAANTGAGLGTTASGWTTIDEVISTDSAAIFYRLADGTEQANVQPTTLGASAGWNCTLVEYSGVDSGAAPLSGAQASNTATKASPSIAPTAGLEWLLVGGVMSSTAGGSPYAAQQIGGVAATVRSDISGVATAQSLFDRIVASASGSYAATATASVSNNGSGHIAAFRGQAAAKRLPRLIQPAGAVAAAQRAFAA